jgi:hypothetical protein
LIVAKFKELGKRVLKQGQSTGLPVDVVDDPANESRLQFDAHSLRRSDDGLHQFVRFGRRDGHHSRLHLFSEGRIGHWSVKEIGTQRQDDVDSGTTVKRGCGQAVEEQSADPFRNRGRKELL